MKKATKKVAAKKPAPTKRAAPLPAERRTPAPQPLTYDQGRDIGYKAGRRDALAAAAAFVRKQGHEAIAHAIEAETF